MLSSWTDENSSVASRPTSQMKIVTSDEDSLACIRWQLTRKQIWLFCSIRCRGKVFDAEKIFGSHGLFHRRWNTERCQCMLCIPVLIDISVVTTVPSAASPWSPALGLMLRTERFSAGSATANCTVFMATASGLADLPGQSRGEKLSRINTTNTQFFWYLGERFHRYLVLHIKYTNNMVTSLLKYSRFINNKLC